MRSIKKSRLAKFGAAAVASVLILTGCSGNKLGEEGESDGTFKVFFTADMSGATATFNRGLLSGIKAAIGEINENGGVAGREIELVEHNDQNDPTTAVSALQKEINSGNRPDLVYPGGSSAVTLSLLPITSKEKILSLGATVATEVNDPDKYPYHFGTAEPGQAYVPAFIKIAQEQGYKKVAMIYANTPTGQAAEKYYREAIEAEGMELQAVGYDNTALDMTPQLAQLKSGNPDALVLDGYGTPVQYVVRSRAGMNWDIPTFTDQTASTFPFVAQFSDEELTGLKVVQANWTVREDVVPEEMKKFVETVKQHPEADTLDKTGVRLSAVAAATVQLVAWAAEHNGGKTDADSITNTLENDLPEKGGDATPWVTDSKGENYFRFSGDDHFPTPLPGTYLYIDPGMYDEDGLYIPGMRP